MLTGSVSGAVRPFCRIATEIIRWPEFQHWVQCGYCKLQLSCSTTIGVQSQTVIDNPLAEPEERRKREISGKALPENPNKRAEAAKLRPSRYPEHEEALPPFDRVLMASAGPVVFRAVACEVVEPGIVKRFYTDIPVRTAALVWVD